LEKSVAERQVLFDAIFVRGVNSRQPAQSSAAFGALALAEVPATGAGAQDFAPRRNLETLGYGFLRFDAFGTSHKSSFFPKERAV